MSSGGAADPGPAERPTAMPAADGPVTTRYPVMVIDDGSGPEACLGGVADSLPPQCQGPPLSSFDWADHEGSFESRAGVRWGEYQLAGTFDGTALTVTEVVSAEDSPQRPQPDGREKTPCPAPPGGWVASDPSRSGERSLGQLRAMAQQREDFALLWVDQSINPAFEQMMAGETGIEIEMAMNDPRLEIVNIQVTGDPAAADAEFRTIWGGSLCVTQVAHTERELLAAQQDLNGLPGFQGSSGITIDNHGELTVVYDDGSYQRWIDETYGEGVVVVTSALTPVGD